MKSRWIILIACVLWTHWSVAQPPGPPPAGDRIDRDRLEEQMESLRVAFITEKLDLSSEEAQRFWPVYNEMKDEFRKLEEEKRAMEKDFLFEEVTDEEVSRMIDENLKREQEMLDLKIRYNDKLKEVLPVRKVAMLYTVEQEFKRELLRKFRDRWERDRK